MFHLNLRGIVLFVCAFTFEIARYLSHFNSGAFKQGCCASSMFYEACVASARLAMKENMINSC